MSRRLTLRNESRGGALILFDNGYVNPIITNFTTNNGFRRGTTSEYVVGDTIYKGRNTGTRQSRTIYTNSIDLRRFNSLHFIASCYKSTINASVSLAVSNGTINNRDKLNAAFPLGTYKEVQQQNGDNEKEYIIRLETVSFDISNAKIFAYCDSWGGIYEQTITKIWLEV